jgi:transketolase
MNETIMLKKMADTVRFLAADMVQSANSGHPGMPMGMADILTVFSSHYKHNPKNPKWLNRDRVVFSGGHGSALIYSLLHLWGYDVSLDDLKKFRQLGSKTAGHPEYGHIDGVEVTTGPLGQGFANAVGFSMASKYAAHLLNDPVAKIIDHKVYCFCGDGDLQEGISYESASIAGHNKLDNLVVVYDSNDITIEGDLSISFSEDVAKRFEAQEWKCESVDGHDYDAINAAFERAKKSDRPYLIIAKTKIGKGAATLEGSHHTHGAPLGSEEIGKSKTLAGFAHEEFCVPEDALIRFRCALEKGDLAEREWKKLLTELPEREKGDLLARLQNPDFNTVSYPSFETGKKVATRDSNGQILNEIAKCVPSFIGGSADLAPSNKTELKGMGDFPKGKNIRYGIREHAMGAITNAISLYGLFAPFCSTFFVFSDYVKPAIRVTALMKVKAFFVFTHDSIGVGEDGPTHQPIEHLSALRALPNLLVFRPCDANENALCWQAAFAYDGPSAFVLSRQGLTVYEANQDTLKGGYIISACDNAKLTLMATGSEVEICVEAAKLLSAEGVATKVVSVPCFELFAAQSNEYKQEALGDTKVLAVEAASGLEWYKFADEVLCMESFGASGKDNDLFAHFGFTAQNIVSRAKALL